MLIIVFIHTTFANFLVIGVSEPELNGYKTVYFEGQLSHFKEYFQLRAQLALPLTFWFYMSSLHVNN